MKINILTPVVHGAVQRDKGGNIVKGDDGRPLCNETRHEIGAIADLPDADAQALIDRGAATKA